MTDKPKRGPKPGTGGRPVGSTKVPPKVKLTCRVLPSTLEAIKALGGPGAVLDATFTQPVETRPKEEVDAAVAEAQRLFDWYFLLPQATRDAMRPLFWSMITALDIVHTFKP